MIPEPDATPSSKRRKAKNEAKVLPFPEQPAIGTPKVVTPSDHELLERCRSRDADAWDQLVSRYDSAGPSQDKLTRKSLF